MQSLPDADSGPSCNGKLLTDGRTFVFDFDQAMQRKMTLVEGPSSESP